MEGVDVFFMMAVCFVAVVGLVSILHGRGNDAGKHVISRHDEMYQLPPGALPGPEGAPTRRATADDVGAPVAVRFEPPTGVLPEQVGMLTTAQTQGTDVAAAIIQLAVDGYLHLGRVERHSGLFRKRTHQEWLITALRPVDPTLTPFRAGLLAALTELGRPATITELKPGLAKAVPELREALRGHPDHDLWFPNMRGGTVPFGKCLTTPGARQRSALGTALRYQCAGFRHFLEVADGNQLRFEEGAGIFSRYLPWAVAFGVTDQWVLALGDAARGLDGDTAVYWCHDLAWYGDFSGFDADVFNGLDGLGDGLGEMMSSLGDAMADLSDGITDLASDLGDAGDAGSGGGDGGGDGGGGGD